MLRSIEASKVTRDVVQAGRGAHPTTLVECAINEVPERFVGSWTGGNPRKKGRVHNLRSRRRQREGGKDPEVQVEWVARGPTLLATQNARNLNSPVALREIVI